MTADVATVAFFLSAVTLLYVVIVYPLLLTLWPAKQRQQSGTTPEKWRTVTVILPVRNGERWIRKKLESLLALEYPRDLVDIIVISDNSTDRTEEIVRSFEPAVKLLQNPGRGKASAINHALAHATGDILFFNDVRQLIDGQSLRVLVSCFDDPRVGVATGELIILSGEKTEQKNVGMYWRLEKWIRQRHSGIDSVLGATGAIYAMRRNLARPLPANTLLDDVHLPMHAFFAGYRIVWAGEARAYDSPTALNDEFRRKVRTLAGVYQLAAQFPGLLGPSNRMWFHFMSHKIGRLLLPFALIGIFISSVFLPAPWPKLLVPLQIAFYGMAVADLLTPESTLLKRLTSIARTFVVLVAAAFCAASILFRRPESFWDSPTKT
jgi:biofilm PGA synthesis N-glycosyltransferase PgaC